MNSNAEAFAPQSGLFEFDKSLLLAAPEDQSRGGSLDSARGTSHGVMPSLRTSPAASVSSVPSPRDDLLLSPNGSRFSLGQSPARQMVPPATDYPDLYGQSHLASGPSFDHPRLHRISQPDNLYDGLTYGSSDPLPPPQMSSLHSSWPRYMEDPRAGLPGNSQQLSHQQYQQHHHHHPHHNHHHQSHGMAYLMRSPPPLNPGTLSEEAAVSQAAAAAATAAHAAVAAGISALGLRTRSNEAYVDPRDMASPPRRGNGGGNSGSTPRSNESTPRSKARDGNGSSGAKESSSSSTSSGGKGGSSKGATRGRKVTDIDVTSPRSSGQHAGATGKDGAKGGGAAHGGRNGTRGEDGNAAGANGGATGGGKGRRGKGRRGRGDAQDASQPPAPPTSSVCKHWAAGYCRFGPACKFAHPPEELGSAAAAKQNDDAVGNGSASSAVQAVLSQAFVNAGLAEPMTAGAIARAWSRVCKHWLRGYCRLGDQCMFLHERPRMLDSVVGTVTPDASQAALHNMSNVNMQMRNGMMQQQPVRYMIPTHGLSSPDLKPLATAAAVAAAQEALERSRNEMATAQYYSGQAHLSPDRLLHEQPLLDESPSRAASAALADDYDLFMVTASNEAESDNLFLRSSTEMLEDAGCDTEPMPMAAAEYVLDSAWD
uniref:C3H1-type domain-containing protein n=1 Tax=Sexangularia sp. CB-2014 TaxID=1486929 RepID=A0A7S1VMS8_9EUKA|mmetsp:Transcript_5595/g.18174  ORF Transcript_5595/g.18174 Transcript_5595/m.18174 type:complete len:655 (+) Transcript_5595:99-2063(+)|eukprot:CAMPEP_0170740912 /NCGR_PEP_ID=MMETSP0437-20130122/5938_1 /TAXON_ID=0 /ORGANISM="Sexangularia sp." /LENGTH=654 /DNA_ID=CAMNT_0011079447 /DNA_START=232 /DNA_END=2196 /DNA_ORIENTATION=+